MTDHVIEGFPRLSIRVGWIKHEIMSALGAKDSMKSHEIFTMFKAKAKDMTSEQFITHHVGLLLTAGLVTFVDNAWALTIDGRLRLRELNDQVLAGPKVKKAAMPISKENYLGAELKNTCTREGAYVAFGLPSLINGRVMERVSNV